MSACCCMGPQNGAPLCPCRMALVSGFDWAKPAPSRNRDMFEFCNDWWPFDSERDYRMDRPYELLEDWAAKQREIARELARD